jgi:hypothetical protein
MKCLILQTLPDLLHVIGLCWCATHMEMDILMACVVIHIFCIFLITDFVNIFQHGAVTVATTSAAAAAAVIQPTQPPALVTQNATVQV